MVSSPGVATAYTVIHVIAICLFDGIARKERFHGFFESSALHGRVCDREALELSVRVLGW